MCAVSLYRCASTAAVHTCTTLADWGIGGHFKVQRGVGLFERSSAAFGFIDAEDEAESPRCVSEAGNCAKSNCSPGQPCKITNSCDGDAVLEDFPGVGAYPFLLGTRKGNTCDNGHSTHATMAILL